MDRCRTRINAVAFGLLLVSVAASVRADSGQLVTEGVVSAPVSEVWRLFTTEDGMESWMVAHADIDLKVGGLMRTQYDPKGTLGDDKTIVNQILSYEPERMLSLRVYKAPADFPYPKAIESMWTVIYFQPLQPGDLTYVRIVGMGFGDDADSQKLKEFFRKGNGWTLEQLQKKFWAKCARCEKEKEASP